MSDEFIDLRRDKMEGNIATALQQLFNKQYTDFFLGSFAFYLFHKNIKVNSKQSTTA